MNEAQDFTPGLAVIPEDFSFVISRKRWLRGEGNNASKLLRGDDRKMCCVGICLAALGIPEDKLANIATALGVRLASESVMPKQFRRIAAALNYKLAEVVVYDHNDNPHLVDREAVIIEDFKKMGITVTFED